MIIVNASGYGNNVNNQGNLVEQFISKNYDLFAQVFYVFIWNHHDGISDESLCNTSIDEMENKRTDEFKEELVSY